MNFNPISKQLLASSVIAVPPLARNADLQIHGQRNRQIIEYLEEGGITTLLYGGNAVLYHIAPSEYATLLEFLADAASDDTCVIPSVGPSFGMMMDQAAILRGTGFPTVMVLPQQAVATTTGIATGMTTVFQFQIFTRPVFAHNLSTAILRDTSNTVLGVAGSPLITDMQAVGDVVQYGYDWMQEITMDAPGQVTVDDTGTISIARDVDRRFLWMKNIDATNRISCDMTGAGGGATDGFGVVLDPGDVFQADNADSRIAELVEFITPVGTTADLAYQTGNSPRVSV